MTDNLTKKLTQLKQALEQGIIDEETYRSSLVGLGLAEAEIEASLGSGTITQASHQTGGKRSVVGSSAGRDIITGEGNSVTTIINQYLAQTDQPVDEATLRRQMASYLAWMVDRYSTIELRGIKREGQQVVQLDLETVYVPLAARAYRAAEAKEIELDQVLQQGKRLVITGGPGSGKTTVLLHLAYILSYAIGANRPALVTEKLGLTVPAPPPPAGFASWKAYFERESPEARARFLAAQGEFKNWEEYFLQFAVLPLPILIPLSSYALYLRQLPAGAKSEEKTLAAFISCYLIQHQTSFELPDDFFQQLLRSGQNVLLLLDGLDEVPTEPERAEVRQAIENLLAGREELRVVVTCRTAAYRGRTALGRDFRPVEVLPLNEEHVAHLVHQAYADIYGYDPGVARQKEADLLAAIADLEQQRRRRFGRETDRLITSPLLVRMLLVVHYSERRLPDQRAELYMKATDAMLLPEYAPDEAVANRIGRLVGESQSVHRELVQHLAFAMHQRGETQGREIEEDDLRHILQEHPSYGHLTGDFISLTRQRGTLLEERLGQYRFLHLAFQEYLVARYLAETIRSDSGLGGIAEFLENGPLLDSWWREPALLVVGYLSIGTPSMAQKLLRRLAGLDLPAGEQTDPRSPEIQVAAAELSGAAALEWPAIPASLKTALAGRVVDLFRRPALLAETAPTLRAAAGNTLAHLGDPRPPVTTLEGMEFCYIPPGPFMMGSPDEDEMARDDEKPLHEVDVSYGYWLARYPVTVAQWRLFVERSGYKPNDEDSLRGTANHPVNWVTWHDAIAFCKWLTEEWGEQGMLPPGWQVLLPSEAEWEKAARGGLKQPRENIRRAVTEIDTWQPEQAWQDNNRPQRRYPWGEKIDPKRANYDDTGIGTTSAMGCFPAGASPYGCEEMAGNVLEWCRTKWQDSYEDYQDDNDLAGSGNRVLRGGSFFRYYRYVRCAVRSEGGPDDWDGDGGFRVLLAPFFNSEL